MKIPKTAKLLLERNKEYSIEKIHYSSKQVTLRESEKVYNTVSVEDVEFNFSDFSDCEKREFLDMLR